jgi:hypothetical protein
LWNEKRYTQAVREFEKWDHVDGKVIPGLLRRRLKERDCFLGKFKDGKLIPHPDHEVQDRVQPAQPQELPHDV